MKKVTFLGILAMMVMFLAACAPKAEAVPDQISICYYFRDLNKSTANSFRAVKSFDVKTSSLEVEINDEFWDLTVDPKERVSIVNSRSFNGEPSAIAGSIEDIFANVTPNDGEPLDIGEGSYYLFCNSGQLWLVWDEMLSWVDINTWNGLNTELVVWPVQNGPYLVENTTTGQVTFAQDIWGKGDSASKWGYLDPGDGRWGYVYVEGKSVYVTQSQPDLEKMANVVEDVNKVLLHDYTGPAEACATVEYFGTVEEFRGIEPGLKEKIIEECGVFGLGYSRW